MPAKLSHCRPFQPQLDCQLQAIVGHPEAWEVRLPPCTALPPIGPNQDNMCSPRMPCTASNLLLLASALCANGKLCRGHLDSAGCPRRTRRACNLCQQCFFLKETSKILFWTKLPLIDWESIWKWAQVFVCNQEMFIRSPLLWFVDDTAYWKRIDAEFLISFY